MVERIVLDHCIRSLPAEAKRYAAQTSPADIETLTALLENHQVTVEVMKVNCQDISRMGHPSTRGERGGPPKNQGDSQVARSVTPAQAPNPPLWQPSDIQSYPTAQVEMISPRGGCTFKAGVIDCLPVSVLLGRVCPVYERYWPLDLRKTPPRPKSRLKRSAEKPQSFWVFAAPSDQQSGSESMTPESGVVNVPPEDEAETPLNFEDFSEFPQAEVLERGRPGQFGTAQLQDPKMENGNGKASSL